MTAPRFNRILGVPNLLTLLRLLALVPVVLLFRNGHHAAAGLLFLAAMATDALDGWLARRWDRQSALGVFLDPVVDKVVILCLFYELAFAGMVDLVVPHLFLARELLQNAVRNAAASRGRVVGANWMGKTKALGQTVIVAVGLLLPGRAAAGAQVLNGAAWAVLLLAWVFFFVFLKWNRELLRGPNGRPLQPGDTHHGKEAGT